MFVASHYPIRWVCSRCHRGLAGRLRTSLRPLRLPVRGYSTSPDPNAIEDLNLTRNIGIIAHIDAGKTTTTERMLYYSGFTRRLGDVDDGSTVTDFLPAERARGITIQSAAITFHWPPVDQSTASSEDAKAKGLPRSVLPHTINLIDTPGHADFTFEVLRSLRILDGAVCILDGVAGVEAQTEQVWHQASTYSIPRIAYVNKLDREGAAFGRTVKEIGSRLGAWPAVCQIPWFEGGDGKFRGVGDIISLQGLYWEAGGDGKQIIASGLKDLEQQDGQFAQEMKNARIALVELLSEHDDTMVECFLEHDEDHLAVKPIEIWESLRRCLLRDGNRVIPTFAGASFRNIGVQPLLDAVVNLLPSPTERPDPEVSIGSVKTGLQNLLAGKVSLESTNNPTKHKHKKKHASLHSDTTTALQKLECCALAFKVVSDARKGVLVYARVYSGTLNRNALLFNTNLDVSERAPRIFKMYANEAVEVQSIPAGHIGVIAGLKFARTGDTLLSFTGNKQSAPELLNTLQLRPIDVPPPVFFTSVEPYSLSEEKNMQDSLALLLREDPSLHVSVDEDSGQTLLSGMGELHLEIASDRLVKDFKAKVSTGHIEIGYRECISEASSSTTRIFDKEIAGRKGKAGCAAVVQPLYEGQENERTEDPSILFSKEKDGNRITIKAPGLISTEKTKLPGDLLPHHLSLPVIQSSIYNGCLAGLTRGPKYSFPVHSVDVTLTFDITEHLFGSDTTPSALSAAARLATQSALKEVSSNASLMEPVMNVSISVQESSLGAVVHDISSSRGGHIVSLDDDTSSSAEATLDLPPIDVSKIYAPRDPFGSSSPDDRLSNATANQSRMITAKVPLKEMVGYLKHLRSLTGGRGTFVMSVDRFEKMNNQREKAVLTEMRGL
ncbi:Ribosome-releasing factor 2, mitochondrial [Coccidioides posadasii str. Silveira]|uniref:Ribosome-releasing factor 2, mitochondrial n=1 Tax=Coccidioides posadasii (strain RMSCC 757 / Silveira) TaxID=443226 RepID=E9CUD4_COCPS|nr:elongation factor G [Coccidioides posadasii str. Silveira]QVM12002.1 Ribosome-releasing factor 2, mitochondrial [Coccidioides posadasii str. Silveira]